VKEFVEKQFNEDSFPWLRKIENLGPADFLKIIRQIRENIFTLKKEIKNTAGQALQTIAENGLVDSDFFQGKGGIAGYFKKCSVLNEDRSLMPGKNALKTIEEGKWTSSKVSEHARYAIESIKEELAGSFQHIQQLKDEYLLLRVIFKKIYALALANEIRTLFDDYTHRTQKVHISDFNKRISREIAGQPVPFIYERLGRRYRYFLIDEFQDTSVLQWQNLLPLIEESLANGHFNMLVGDAKQAIYRFRNGEVDLFVHLPGIYPDDGSPLTKQREQQLKAGHRIEIIKENWRSREEVIRFNNRFFEVIKNDSNDRIKKIYENHEQLVPRQKKNVDGGYVSVEMIEAENKDEYMQKRLNKILEYVQRLKAKSYENKDICVLSNTNTNAADVASFLLRNGYPVISPESLLIENSPAIRIIIALLKLLPDPASPVVLAEVARNRGLLTGNRKELHDLFRSFTGPENVGTEEIFKKLGVKSGLADVMNKPVYEIVEWLIRELELNAEVDIYLQYFLDFIFDAHEKGIFTISDFIDLWEEKKSKAFITLNPDENAIQVMTIHKAKGLKFETVIVDIAGGRNGNTKDELWTEIKLPGAEDLKVAMLPSNSTVANAGFGELYIEEVEKSELDYINMIYVAFTRAVSALFIMGHETGRGNFPKMLKTFLKSEGVATEGEVMYETGTLPVKAGTNTREEISTGENKVLLKKMISSSWDSLIKVARTDEIYWEAIDSKPARTYGKLIHAMLSEIYHIDDISKVVGKYYLAGIIDEKESEEISKLLEKVVSHEKLKSLFGKDVVVKNELDLIEAENDSKKVLRPDRVVLKDGRLVIVDYKTGEKSGAHIRQINQYAEAFEKLGYSDIEMKLVYLDNNIEVLDLAVESSF
ncbi:MAG: UvrD-helicase domain-containing protein, partial [Chlorobi bacterium]|nr:UvrD-helicase domain-containing protein [Chlorobiota bacterium]